MYSLGCPLSPSLTRVFRPMRSRPPHFLMVPTLRGRGSHLKRRVRGPIGRSIPAWAGEPAWTRRMPLRRRVHSRVGGGARTPAPIRGLYRVHPRVGGGAFGTMSARPNGAGPSPRGRGSHRSTPVRLTTRGSIPAWAGEPTSALIWRYRGRVHPRVGGGAAGLQWTGNNAAGPSPRGRGSQTRPRYVIAENGSIPAWAEEPSARRAAWFSIRVHPRVGGGASVIVRI